MKNEKVHKNFRTAIPQKKNAPHSVNEIEKQLIPPTVERKQLNQL